MKKIVFSIMVAGLFVVPLMAQTIVPQDSFIIDVDYARFHNDEQSGYFEVYYGLYPYLLTYHLSNDHYSGGVKLTTRLINSQTQKAVIHERVLLPITVVDTSETTFKFPFVSQAGYAVPFGIYTLEVVAVDSLNPARRDSVSLPVRFHDYGEKVICSDLELCSKIKTSSRKNNPFYKNSLEVVPNATLIFGVTAYPVIFHYLELYNLTAEQNYTVKTQIVDFQDEIVRESSKSCKFNFADAIDVGTTAITSIQSGKYRFRVVILDENSQELSRTEKTFFIYNPHLQAPKVTVSSFDAGELAGLSDKELTAEFQEAKYIATTEEIRSFKLIHTEAGKREFLANFWRKLAKGRSGRPPIRRGDYLRSIDKANEMYSEMGKQGWQTDRGRVFILYGMPDDIERFPSMGESKPYEIWRYHNIENGVEFVFVDRLGYGHYELVNSTKRGELRDDNWRQYLK